jgi:hypothetical protein
MARLRAKLRVIKNTKTICFRICIQDSKLFIDTVDPKINTRGFLEFNYNFKKYIIIKISIYKIFKLYDNNLS